MLSGEQLLRRMIEKRLRKRVMRQEQMTTRQQKPKTWTLRQSRQMLFLFDKFGCETREASVMRYVIFYYLRTAVKMGWGMP